MQYIQLQSQAANATPTPESGKFNFFIDENDNLPKIKDSNGTIITVDGEPISLVSTTYDGFITIIMNNDLVKGTYYEINDFETCYDQPDFDRNGNAITSGNYKTSGNIEPIIVFAIGTGEISDQAFQLAYPKDKIKYDWTYAVTEVTAGSAKGRITERIDEYGNRTDYDHRNILFKRYENYVKDYNQKYAGTVNLSNGVVTGTNTLFSDDLSENNIIIIDDIEYRITEITDNTNMVVTGLTYNNGSGQSYYGYETFSLSYKRNNLDVDPSSSFTEHHTFDLGDDDYINNYIGNFANLRNWSEHTFLLANNVFTGDNYVNNRFGDNCYNNTLYSDDSDGNVIGNYFHNNTISNDFDHNIIGDEFHDNYISSDFQYNTIGYNFYNNVIINEDFYRNHIANEFYNNHIVDDDEDFQNNTISNGFNNNVITRDFIKNQISVGFNQNNIYVNFEGNSIGAGFNNNEILRTNAGGEFYDNTIGNYFEDNNITRCYFNDNKIGNYFESNNIIYGYTGDTQIYFESNTISDNFENNEINVDFGNNNIGNDAKGNLFGRDDNNNGGIYGNTISRAFYTNEILGDFSDNTIGNYFAFNNTNGDFTHNQIGVWFESNNVQNEFSYNVILNNFYNNEIGEYFGYGYGSERGNVIGNNFQNNTIRNHFYDNKISDNFTYNTTPVNFQYNDVKYPIYNVNFTTYNKNITNITFNTPASTVDGNYDNVAYTTESEGSGAQFQVRVAGGVVTGITIQNIGYDYNVNDTITIAANQFNGTSSGITITITTVSGEAMVAGDYNCTISKGADGILLSALTSSGLYWMSDINNVLD